MNIERIKQSMLKQAANPAKIDQTKLYSKPKDIPGGPAAYVSASGGSSDRYKTESWNNFWKQRGNWRNIGVTPFDYKFDTKNGHPVINWRLHTGDQDNTRDTKILPNQLVSSRAGAWLMSPSYQSQQQSGKSGQKAIYLGRPHAQLTDEIIREANAGRAQFTLQPYTNEKLMQVLTLDPKNRNYLNELLNHYRRIPQENWRKANLQLSDPAEIEAWKKAVPPLDTKEGNGNGMYYPTTGNISLSTDNALQVYNDLWNNKANTDWWEDGKIQESFGRNQLTSTPTVAGSIGDRYGHEAWHRAMMGLARVAKTGGAPEWAYSSAPFNPRKPVSAKNVPAVMRPLNWRDLLFTDLQYNSLRDHAIQEYAVNETEMNQALTSFNRGRWALKRDIENNSDNPNYKYLEEHYPGLIEQFKATPDFIPAGNEGKKQLDSVMKLFEDNPQLRLLMQEQSRLVGYYQNLKKAVETAKTPEERKYFQNLMDRLVYSKAFLANNQRRPVPSYAESYQAYA